MTQIDRYIIRKLFLWVVVVQLCASFLFLLTQVSRLAPLFAGVEDVSSLYLAFIWVQVPIAGWALEPAWVIAIFSVAGAMTQRGELLAVEAAGISRWRLLRWPIVLVAVWGGISCFLWLYGAPFAQQRLQKFVEESLSGAVLHSIVPGQTTQPLSDLSIYVDNEFGPGEFGGIVIHRQREQGAQLAVAEKAKITAVQSARVVRVQLMRGELFDMGERLAIVQFETLVFELAVYQDVLSQMDFLPVEMGKSTAELWNSMHRGNQSQTEVFEFWRRIARPMELMVLSLGSLAAAFGFRWKNRSLALGAAVAMFTCIHLLVRAGEVAMGQKLVSPVVAAFIACIALLLAGGMGIAFCLAKKQSNGTL